MAADEYFPQGYQQNPRWQQMRGGQYVKQKQMLGMRQQYSPAYNPASPAFNFSAQPQPGPNTPRDSNFRDFGTPQRDFGTPGVPAREFSATPAPSGTPAMGTPALPQPQAFVPNRTMGTPQQLNMPLSRTGTPIVRPATAMSGSFDMRTSQPPHTPKMPNGMNIPALPNMAMPMNMNMNMNMNVNMNPMANVVPGNMPMNMCMNMPMNMPNMSANMSNMPATMPATMPTNMPMQSTIPANITTNMPIMPMSNMSPTKPIGLGISVGGSSNALGMGGMGMAINGMGGNVNGMPINGMASMPNGMAMMPAMNPMANPPMARPNPLNTAMPNTALAVAPGPPGITAPGLGVAPTPTKISRRTVSGAGPLPPSPTKSSTVPSLPLPAGLNQKTTLVTALPLLKDENDVTHGGALPPVSEAEMKDIKYWMGRDTAFQEMYSRVRDHRKEEETQLRAKHAWWEMDETSMPGVPGKFSIWWPADHRKIRERKMKLLGRKDLDVSKLAKAGPVITQPELLVPIRLEIDHDHYRLRDTFTWNLNDPVITPEVFAQCLCDDFQIPSNSVVQAVAKSITEQLAEHRAHIVETASGPKRDLFQGEMTERDQEWWTRWRARVADNDAMDVFPDDEPEIEEIDEKDVNEELRVLIKLDVIAGSMNLIDQFEWDMNDPSNSPEDFAEVYCRELGLGGEFKTAVAHSIREQVSVYQKSLFLVGHPFDGTPIADDELRTAMLPPIDHSFRFDRTLLEQFTPQLNVLQDGELERSEREREKELKRKRRQTRGRRGIALPDRDLQKTYRTSIGFAELEVPAQQQVQQQAPVTFRRAAAAAASLTIANLAATENGTPVPMPMQERSTPTLQQQQQLQQQQLQQQQLQLQLQQQQLQQQQQAAANKQLNKPKRSAVLQPPPLHKSVFRARAVDAASGAASATTGLEPAEASAARAEFGDTAPEGPTSPGGGLANEVADSDGQAAMLRRVLEKENPESAEGLHANMIDGTWHCSNCGCPESISVGRRKGPLGQGTMCGECGKYWHKHRKPRPVEYNTSIEHHVNLKKQAKAKKRGNKGNVKPSNAREERPPAEAEANGRDSLSPSPPPQKPTPLPFLDPGSPDSTIGPDSPKPEPGSASASASASVPAASTPVEQSTSGANAEPAKETLQANGGTPPASQATSQSSVSTHTRDGVALPQWIVDCLAATQRRYVNDRIDVIAKPRADEKATPEFRLKCLDCPGKLYTPGPDQSLTNFEVHLKNRVHRANVNRRVASETGGAPPEARKATPSAPASNAQTN